MDDYPENYAKEQAKKNLYPLKCAKCKETVWAFLRVATRVPIANTPVTIAYKSKELRHEYLNPEGRPFTRDYYIKYNCRNCSNKINQTISGYMFKLLYL